MSVKFDPIVDLGPAAIDIDSLTFAPRGTPEAKGPPLGPVPLPRYLTPGDPACPLTGEVDEFDRMPLWMDSYFRCSVETEYPHWELDDPALLLPPDMAELRAKNDWFTSGPQFTHLTRQGLPLARSWRMAAFILDTYGDGLHKDPSPARKRPPRKRTSRGRVAGAAL